VCTDEDLGGRSPEELFHSALALTTSAGAGVRNATKGRRRWLDSSPFQKELSLVGDLQGMTLLGCGYATEDLGDITRKQPKGCRRLGRQVQCKARDATDCACSECFAEPIERPWGWGWVKGRNQPKRKARKILCR
jgi:hypothetical protein